MILRNVTVRHGRRALASPTSTSALRQVSTEVKTETPTPPAHDYWSVPGAAAGPPKVFTNAKKKQKGVQDSIFSLTSDSSVAHHGGAWTKPQALGKSDVQLSPKELFAEFRRIQKSTKSIGSRVARRYVPTELVRNPPRPEDVTLELLMASQTHMGHNTSLWNPANSRYIYGVRQGIHVISLEITAAHLRRAARVVEEVAYNGGIILFVGTRKGQMEIVCKAAEMAGSCHLFTKWTPGSITNRDVILRGHDTKVVDHEDKNLDDFDLYKNTSRPLAPDLVVCLNPLENYTLLYECGLKNIPTIGLIDTNADPSWVTYTIPANDDSYRSVAVIAGVLGRAGEAGQKRRREVASTGKVTWITPKDLKTHILKETGQALSKRKEVMGRMQQNIAGFTDEEQQLLRTQYPAGSDLQVGEDQMVDMMRTAAEEDAAMTAMVPNGMDVEFMEIETQLRNVSKTIEVLAANIAESDASRLT